MHRIVICLSVLFALTACDEASPVETVPETAGCGMTLPGVGAWTVAQYDDGYLIDANSEIALRSSGDDLRWHRLDGTASGPVDLGAPFAQDQTVDLYDRDHLLVRGLTANFEQRARLIRLSDNRIVHEIDYRFEGRGEWIISGNTREPSPNPRLQSLRSGKSFGLPCSLCSMIAVDGFGRAWIGDNTDGGLIEVELSTGRVTTYPDLPVYLAQMEGAGLVAGRGEERLLFGAAPTPFIGCGFQAEVASTGHIGCVRDDGFDILDRDGKVVRTLRDSNARRAREFGAGFLVNGREGATWVPFAPSQAVVSTRGFELVTTSHIAIYRDFDASETTILHADGRVVMLDFAVNAPPQVSADGQFGLFRRQEDFAVIDLNSGAVTLEVPLGSGWKRFVGSTLLVEGAPLGGIPPTNLGNVVFPDRRCPVMLYEQCAGEDCTLNIQQFEQPLTEDSSMNQAG